MTYPHGGASEIWRELTGAAGVLDRPTRPDGSPAQPTDQHNPRKHEVRAWGGNVEQRIEAAEAEGQVNADGITAVETRATALEADVAGLQASQTSGLIVRGTWPELQVDAGAADGAGAEVLDGDTGTHQQATATGYDGAVVNNAGRYSWDAAWSRWLWVAETGLSSRAPKNAIQLVPLNQTNVSENFFVTSPVGIDQISPTAGFAMIAPSDRQIGEFGGVALEVAGVNTNDPRQVRYYPGDATDDQIGQMAWKAGDRLEFGPLTAGGWFPLLWPPRPGSVDDGYEQRRTFYSARANQIAAIGALQ